MGITLAVLKRAGYIPEEKARLKISTRCVEIYFFSNFNILFGILFEPEHLLSLREREREREREDIMEITSSLAAGVIKEELKLSP